MKPRLGALLSHPIQYYSPWFRNLAEASDLTVYYAHRQTAEGQAEAGFGTGFEWDIPLLDGYEWRWLNNVAKRPGLTFAGCDTPEIADLVARGRFHAFLIFGWNRKSFLQGAWGALKSRTPLLFRLDSNLNARRSLSREMVKRPVYFALLPRVGHYLSPGIRTDAYLRRYAVPNSRIHRLPHMVDVDRFREGADLARATGDAGALRVRLGAASEDFVLLFVGKLILKKRPQLLIQALQRLRELSAEAAASTRLWVVGDGPLKAELESLVRQEGLPVTFLGFANQSELPALYAAADCLVLPSNGEETWGLVVNEAFACGTPAVVSAEAGCEPELIVEGGTGWTMERPDPDLLARKVLAAWRHARELPRSALEEKSAAACYSTGTQRLLEIVDRVGASR